MYRQAKRWIALVLSVLLALSGSAVLAEEKDEVREWYDTGWEAYTNGDMETAAEYFRKAAEKEDGYALNMLGVLYFFGAGVEQSNEKALEYFERAAAQDSVDALNNLGAMYLYGYCGEQSDEKALEYFLRSVELGDAAACDWVGSFYQEGRAVEQSDEKAAEYYRMSADKGFYEGQIMLGVCYKHGTGVEQSYETAAKYFRLAAEQGEAYGYLNLGDLYENGLGVEQSYETAAEYYRTAAELGNVIAQDYLGQLYEKGNGVEQSWEKAAEYYGQGAEQAEANSYPEVLVHLARLYREGLGVEQSAEKAAELLARAVQLGSEEAQQALEELAAEKDTVPEQTEGIVIPEFTAEELETYEIPDTEAMRFVQNLKAGWNLGNTFDAKDDGPGDPNRDYETYWSGAKTTKALVRAIRAAGFNVLRIPVSWHNHVSAGDFTIDPAWLARVEEVASWALDEGMYVIINIHHDDAKDYLYPDSGHYLQSEKYLTAIWRQVAAKFADYDEHLIFESMNEPRLVGTRYEWNPDPSAPEVLDAVGCINKLNRKFVETVRAAGGNNASRFLMVPGYSGSCGGAYINEFELPGDDRIIVEVHAYTPYNYALNTANPDSSFDLEDDTDKLDEITLFMDDLYERHVAKGVPVVFDEFGALKKNDGDLQDRVNYTAFYTAQASARGIPVVWWDNSNFTGGGEKFGLIDRNRVEWIYPDIALAILRNCTAGRGE